MNWFGPRGDCGCCKDCVHAAWDWRWQGPGDGGAGDSRLELLGSAYYDGLDLPVTDGLGKIVLPDNTSGIKIKQGRQPSSFENSIVGFDVLTDTSDASIPINAKYRIFFESDYDEQNYIFADVIKTSREPSPGSYSGSFEWIVRLGSRVAGTDSYYTAWSPVTAFVAGGIGYTGPDSVWYDYDNGIDRPFLFLERLGCKGESPLGCADGYALHVRPGTPKPLLDNQTGEVFRQCFDDIGPVFVGLNSYYWNGSEVYYELDPRVWSTLHENFLYGASIELELSDPEDTYSGIRRMDDLGGDLEVYTAVVATAKPKFPEPSEYNCQCMWGDLSPHNVCRTPEFYKIQLTLDGSRYVVEPQPEPRYFGFTGRWLFGGSVGVGLSRFEVIATHRIQSNRDGESNWISRGQDESIEEYYDVYMIEWREVTFGFNIGYERYNYRWIGTIPIPDGDRDLLCYDMSWVLSFDDAVITYEAADGFPSVYDPLTGDMEIQLYQ